MCVVCGRRFCAVECPEYDPWEDPDVRGACIGCGAPLYAVGQVWCLDCEEENDDGIE